MSQPAEQTETLRTTRNATTILNQAVRLGLAVGQAAVMKRQCQRQSEPEHPDPTETEQNASHRTVGHECQRQEGKSSRPRSRSQRRFRYFVHGPIATAWRTTERDIGESCHSCAITPVSDKDDERLRVSIVPKSEPAYAEAQRVLASGTGKDTAFTKVAEDAYVTPDVTGDSDGNRLEGAKGVKVTPDYAVVVEILHPAEGVDAMKEAGPTVQAVADNLAHLG